MARSPTLIEKLKAALGFALGWASLIKGKKLFDITLSPVLGEARTKSPMVYLQASIKLKAGKLEDFVSMLNQLTPVLAKRGMKLLSSYADVVGRLNTVVDFWELPDANALQAALSDPELQKLAPMISEIIEDETQVLLTRLPIG